MGDSIAGHRLSKLKSRRPKTTRSARAPQPAPVASRVPRVKPAQMAVSSRSTFWLMLFAVSSSSMVVSNKIIMHAFPFPMTLLLIQNTIAVVLTLVLALTGHDAFTMKPWDSKHLITWLLPTITFSIMLMTSLLALPHIAVATTVVFRNLGSLLVATIEPLVLTTPPLTSGHKKSLAVIIAGALIYSIFDLNFNQKGYLWISFNTGLFCVQVLIEKYAVSKVDQTATGIACYQNLLSIPVLLVGVMFAGESNATPRCAIRHVWLQLVGLLHGVESARVGYVDGHCRKSEQVVGIGDWCLHFLQFSYSTYSRWAVGLHSGRIYVLTSRQEQTRRR